MSGREPPSCGESAGPGTVTSVPTRTPARSGAPSICLLRSFGVRTCSDNKLGRHERLGRPCLLYHIEKCSGPCIGAVDKDTYAQMLADLMAFLSGDTDPVVGRIESEMKQAAAELDFEKAARLRDKSNTVHLAIERQQVVSMTAENLDVIGLADDDLEAAVCVFHVRNGRVVGRRALRARQGRGSERTEADRQRASSRSTATRSRWRSRAQTEAPIRRSDRSRGLGYRRQRPGAMGTRRNRGGRGSETDPRSRAP